MRSVYVKKINEVALVRVFNLVIGWDRKDRA